MLLLTIICIAGQTLFAQRRNVVFFYGLGKKATESAAYANAFESTRQITSFSDFNYVTQQNDAQGMQKVVDDARTQAATALGGNLNNTQNVAVGHDIGGLIARRINNTHASMFGGLILTGTPNTEMTIVTNYINGRLQREFKATGLNRAPDIKTAFKLGTQDFGQIAIAEIPMKWAEKTFGADPAAVFKSVNDLQKSSRFLNNLGSVPTVPTVAIWGNENDPAVWRFFSSVNGGAIGATPAGTILDSDLTMTDFVSRARDKADNTITSENALGILKIVLGTAAIVTSVIPIFGAGGLTLLNIVKAIVGVGGGVSGGISSQTNFDNAAKARLARDWVDDSQTIWKSLIGATREDIVTVDNRGAMRESCRQGINDPARGWAWYFTTLTSQERNYCWITEITQMTVQVQEESDGVLHKTTQQLGNVLDTRNIIEATGANHEELLNHPGVTRAYNKVWNGESHNFFFTR
ncbi:MAG: hypothetical protein RLZZ628_2993 [Bacteroidota bacterium]